MIVTEQNKYLQKILKFISRKIKKKDYCLQSNTYIILTQLLKKCFKVVGKL